MKCPYCDTLIRPDEKICTGCGYKNPEYNPNAYNNKKEEVKVEPIINDNNKSNTNTTNNNPQKIEYNTNSLVVFIILAVFAPCIGIPILIIYLASQNNKSKNKK